MRPIQFQQDKNALDWKTLKASKAITKASQQMKRINYREPRNDKAAKCWALAEYYTLLFSPEARKVSTIRNEHGLVNLEWLFPSPEPIYISPSTNFIMLPLPLPTFKEFILNCFNAPIITAEPSLYDQAARYLFSIDYRTDNQFTSKHKSTIYSPNHTSATTDINQSKKEQAFRQSPDMSSRLRVYSYEWLSPQDEEIFTSFDPKVNPSSYLSQHDKLLSCNRDAQSISTTRHQNWNDEYLSHDIQHIFQWYSMWEIFFWDRKHKLKKYKYTLLEIMPYNEFVKQYSESIDHPSQRSNAPESTGIRLKNYSQMLCKHSNAALPIDPDLFWFQYYLHTSNWETYAPNVFDYIFDHAYLNQFCTLEIKSKQTMLEDAIKYSNSLYINQWD